MALKSWWEVYPHGTKEGDEESRFFCALARHPDFKYRSVEKLSEEAGLSKSRCEDIISKYHPAGMILQNPKDPDQWGYWERVGAKKSEKDLLEEDMENRLKKNKP
jgi:hypothetical protein